MNAASGAVVLYGHVRSGNAYKVGLMLALTATPFRFERIDLAKGAQHTPQYLAINPFGQVPALRHGDRVITQSNSILAYLGELTGKFWPAESGLRISILEWMFWEQDVFFPGIGRTRFFTKVVQGDPGVVEFFRKTGERGLKQLETRLDRSRFVAGETPTVADVSIYAYARLAEDAGFSLADRPKIVAWRKVIEGLPGWAPPPQLLPES